MSALKWTTCKKEREDRNFQSEHAPSNWLFYSIATASLKNVLFYDTRV